MRAPPHEDGRACAESPPAGVRRKAGGQGGPLHRMGLIGGGDGSTGPADPGCATPVLHRCARRRRPSASMAPLPGCEEGGASSMPLIRDPWQGTRPIDDKSPMG